MQFKLQVSDFSYLDSTIDSVQVEIHEASIETKKKISIFYYIIFEV